MIDVRKLRMLAELERLGTIAAVAEALHLTAPGVSQQLNALERELGVPLTERRGRRLALTPAGVLLAGHGREVMDRLSLAELEVDAVRRGATGAYRVASFPSAARTLVAGAWAALDAAGSGLELEVATLEPEDALAALAAGSADLAVVHSYSNIPRQLPDGILAEPIAEEPVWLALRSDDPLAPHDGGAVELAALSERRWIAPDAAFSCYEMVERACGLAGFRPRIAVRSVDFAVQLAFVAAGAGVALVPDLTVDRIPDGVVLAPLAAPVARFTHAARRSALREDAGLDIIAAELRAAAQSSIRPSTAPRG
ncbi:LysR family transcriptional regulator [Leifsonia poae]|uniref:LysR family transcriptional regulator n=1 Tax=Leifsonia poae TaxID=110933 RepID=UPI003D68C4C9